MNRQALLTTVNMQHPFPIKIYYLAKKRKLYISKYLCIRLQSKILVENILKSLVQIYLNDGTCLLHSPSPSPSSFKIHLFSGIIPLSYILYFNLIQYHFGSISIITYTVGLLNLRSLSLLLHPSFIGPFPGSLHHPSKV